MSVQFIKSAVWKSDYPRGRQPEIAIVGRSNSGKSTLVNALAQKKVAQISQRAGKTRLLNFFDFNEEFILVDMPGYGFAHRSPKEQKDWQKMIEGYLLNRKNLKSLLLIMDVRRDWSQQEQDLVEWIGQRNLPVILILNKIDKLGKNDRINKHRRLSKETPVAAVFSISADKKEGLKNLKEYLLKFVLEIRP